MGLDDPRQLFGGKTQIDDLPDRVWHFSMDCESLDWRRLPNDVLERAEKLIRKGADGELWMDSFSEYEMNWSQPCPTCQNQATEFRKQSIIFC